MSHERLLLSTAAFVACVQPHNPGWTNGVMSDASEKALVHAPQWGGHNHLCQGLFQTSLTEGTPTLYTEKNWTLQSTTKKCVGIGLLRRDTISYKVCMSHAVKENICYIICLFSINDIVRGSYRNISSEYWKGIASLIVPRNLSPMYGIIFVQRRFKNSKVYNECMSLLVLLPPRNSATVEIRFLLQYYPQRAKTFTKH